MQKRRRDYDLAKIQFTQANAGNGMGDKEMETQVRLMHRYKVAAQNRVDKLDRKLKMNQSERRKREQKHYLWEQREKERKEKRDLQVCKMKQREFEQYQQHLDQEDRREARNLYEQRQMAMQEYAATETVAQDSSKPMAEQEMKIQSTPSQAARIVQDVVQKIEKQPMEIPVAIAPEPQELDEELLDLLEELIEEAFAHPPHEKMFSQWPDEFFTRDGMHTLRRYFNRRGMDEALSKTVYQHLMKEFGHRKFTQFLEARTATDSAALKQMTDAFIQQSLKTTGK